ncbi:tyrosine-type recombinase/integrase [Polynucleobacter paneuropaeus]|jgi:integrase|nr:tyrosine-type recombinase/integrase [Polynucleobacter paneuropaeus]
MPLTDLACRNAKPKDKPYTLSDGGSLFLYVNPNGSKLWKYRYRLNNLENIYSIGRYPTISLQEAREEMQRAKHEVKKSISPTKARHFKAFQTKQMLSDTFEPIALEWLNKKRGEVSTNYHQQIKNTLTTYVFPDIGQFPIRQLTSADILKILKKVADGGAKSVATNLRIWISGIFYYAHSTSRVDSNPVLMLRGALPRLQPKHHRPLDKNEIAQLTQSLLTYPGNFQTIIAIKLLMLTFLRTGELRKTKWSEIDFAAKRINVPAERMKMRRPHIVPLSEQSIHLLLELKKYTGNREHLFPNMRDPKACMSATTINRALERMGFAGKDGIGFSGHGFRATASTILHEGTHRTEVIEMQLAHKQSNQIRAIYNQAEYFPERTKLMQDWADTIDQYANIKLQILAS